MSLLAVGSVDIQILVDNVTDSPSSVPSFVETELAGWGGGWRAMSALTSAFGDGKLAPLAVGKRLRF
jgi:hypothetical protein